MFRKLLAGATVFAALATPALAVNVHWALDFTGTYLDDTTLSYTGTFLYDADTDVYSNINIQRSDGVLFDEDLRGLPGPFNAITGLLFGTHGPTDDLTGAKGVTFSASLTNAGGAFYYDTTVNPEVKEFGVPDSIFCGNADCTAAGYEDLFLLTKSLQGSLIGTPEPQPVPLPATALLLGVALAGSGAIARRRRRT